MSTFFLSSSFPCTSPGNQTRGKQWQRDSYNRVTCPLIGWPEPIHIYAVIFVIIIISWKQPTKKWEGNKSKVQSSKLRPKSSKIQSYKLRVCCCSLLLSFYCSSIKINWFVSQKYKTEKKESEVQWAVDEGMKIRDGWGSREGGLWGCVGGGGGGLIVQFVFMPMIHFSASSLNCGEVISHHNTLWTWNSSPVPSFVSLVFIPILLRRWRFIFIFIFCFLENLRKYLIISFVLQLWGYSF